MWDMQTILPALAGLAAGFLKLGDDIGHHLDDADSIGRRAVRCLFAQLWPGLQNTNIHPLPRGQAAAKVSVHGQRFSGLVWGIAWFQPSEDGSPLQGFAPESLTHLNPERRPVQRASDIGA